MGKSTSKTVKNMRELRDRQLEVFNGLLDGTIAPQIAAETTKAAGGVMKGIAQQLRYRKDRKEKPEIGFLKCK